MIFRIAIDPGHGGHDSGAFFNSLNEKDVNLKVSLILQSMILQHSQGNIEPVLTRETDIYIPLHRRCRISNEQGSDYFLSIHCNADPDNDDPGDYEAKGEEIWFCTGSKKGKAYAETISKTIDKMFPDEPFRGVKETSHLYVLKHTLAPANLVELGFIDNSSTNRKFKDSAVITEIARCLFEAVTTIFEKHG